MDLFKLDELLNSLVNRVGHYRYSYQQCGRNIEAIKTQRHPFTNKEYKDAHTKHYNTLGDQFKAQLEQWEMILNIAKAVKQEKDNDLRGFVLRYQRGEIG